VQNIRNSNDPTTFQSLDGASVCQPIKLEIFVVETDQFEINSIHVFFKKDNLKKTASEIFKKPNGTQICFTAKAYNGRVLSQWLSDCLRDAISKHYHDGHEQLPPLASCMFLGLKLAYAVFTE